MTPPAESPEPGRQTALLCLLGALAFTILLSYALARPAAESLFLETHTARRLPLGWLGVTLGAALAAALFQRAAARVALTPLLLISTALSAALLLALLLHGGATLLLYVWKDVYVVVLLKIFWSLANVLCTSAAARRSYGWFCALGSLGGIIGNLGGGVLAARVGSRGVLWLVLPALAGVALCGAALLRRPEVRRAAPRAPAPGDAAEARPQGSLGLLWHSDYLMPLLCMVAVVQLVITLVDFQCNAALELAYPQTDARTAIIGRLYAAVDVTSLVLQALTGPLLRLGGQPLGGFPRPDWKSSLAPAVSPAESKLPSPSRWPAAPPLAPPPAAAPASAVRETAPAPQSEGTPGFRF